MKPSNIGKYFLIAIALGYPWQAPVAGGQDGTAQIQWFHSLSEAKAEATSQKKLIILDLFTDWCGWCKQMDVQTWAHPAVVSESDKYVFLKLNEELLPREIALHSFELVAIFVSSIKTAKESKK